MVATKDAAYIRPKYLQSQMKKESQLMIMLIKCIDKCGLSFQEENSLGQSLNDCATLKFGYKCMVIELEMVDLSLKCDLYEYHGIVRVKDGTDEAGHALMNKIWKKDQD